MLDWEDDDEEPAGSRPEQSEDVWDDADDYEDGEWIVDPNNPAYEIFVPDEEEDER